MKAWIIEKLAGIDGLKIADLPDPQPAPGEVVLQVLYAGLNPADRYLAEGQYPARPTFPHILGRDGIGTVLRLGAGVTEFSVGQKLVIVRSEVGVNRPGTFAQQVAVPAESLTPPPAGWTDTEAAAPTLVYLTAYQALTQWKDPPLPHRAVVLVTGASGGVGVASVQLAKALGHTVIGLTRNEEKGRKLLGLGADVVFDPADKTWSKKCREWLGKQRVDLAIDNVGGALLPEVIDCLAMHGRVSIVGRLAGPVPNFNTAMLFFRRIRLGGVAVGTYTPPESHAAWGEVLSLLAKIAAKPQVDQIFPFAQLPQAFARLAAGPMGKVLLQVA